MSDVWQESLKGDEGVQRLARGLALADGFSFHLLVARAPKVARGVYALLPVLVGKLRGGEVGLRRRDPYEGEDLLQPLRPEAAQEKVLEPLLYAQGDEAIEVIDASRAVAEDGPAWVELFERLNERRNAVQTRHRGPLLLCVPPFLERPFAEAAPDFWSVRSGAILVQGPPLPGLPPLLGLPLPPTWIGLMDLYGQYMGHENLGRWQEEAKSSLQLGKTMDIALWQGDWELAKQVPGRAQRRISPERVHQDIFAPGLLVRQGALDCELGNLFDSTAACSTALHLVEQESIGGRGPREELTESYRAAALLGLGDICVERAVPGTAARFYQESAAIRNQSGSSVDFPSIAGKVRLARVFGEMGDLDSAESALTSSNGAVLRWFRAELSMPELNSIVSATRFANADLHWLRGDVARALAMHRAMGDVAQRMGPQEVPSQFWEPYLETARQLSSSLCRQGDLLSDLGQREACLAALEKGLSLWGELTKSYPLYRPHKGCVSDLLVRLLTQREATGDFAGASATAKALLDELKPEVRESRRWYLQYENASSSLLRLFEKSR